MRFTKTELLREREFRRCRGQDTRDRAAFEYWCRHYVRIQVPEKGSVRFELFDAQRDIMDVWMQERYSIVLKARQIGWTTLAAIYSLWLAFFWPDQSIVFLSKKQENAEFILGKSIYAYERLPAWMQERGPKRATKNKQDITFGNGSKIRSLPSKEDPARGHTVDLVIVDEWAFLDNPENAWASIEPITDVGGRCIGLSTANGWGDFFHEMWVRARAGIGQFKPMFYPWSARDDRDASWYEAKCRDLEGKEWQLHQEYPSTEDEAFVKSGRPVFDVDKLAALRVEEPARGRLDATQGSHRSPNFVRERNGPFAVFEMPRMGEQYVVGADVAEGLAHGDFSSAHVVHVRTGMVVAHYHARVDPDLFGERVLSELGYFYNQALIAVEVNNHGLTTCKALQRDRYPKVYYRRILDTAFRTQQKMVGWRTDMRTKPLMIDELARALRDEAIDLRCAHTVAELRTYVRDERGGMQGSPFDDRVVSLAIAVQMLNHAADPEYERPEERFGSFEWHMKQLLRDDSSASSFIGQHNVRRSAASQPGSGRIGDKVAY